MGKVLGMFFRDTQGFIRLDVWPRQLHRLKTSTTMNPITKIFLISVCRVSLRNMAC